MKTMLAVLITVVLSAVSSYGNGNRVSVPDADPPGWPLIMSTYLGGSGQEGSNEFPLYMDATEDDHGNLFIVATTTSSDLPLTPGSYQCGVCGGVDILIAKLDPALTSVVAMVRLGGSGEETYPQVAVGMDERIYVLTRTSSADFPTTVGAYSRTRRGPTDFAITEFDSSLTTIVASSYFGGYGNEDFPDLAISEDGDVYVSGHVFANTVPTTPGAYRTTYAGGGTDCFVSRFSPNLDTLKASTLIGGRYVEESGDLKICPNGDVVLGLGTDSDNYPTTPGVFGPSLNGAVRPGENVDCAISRFNADLSVLIASTYVGGSEHDRAIALDADADGNVWFVGPSFSPDYPTTEGAFDRVKGGGHEEFVSELSADLSQLLASTFLSPGFDAGGTPQINDILIDPSGLVYVTGLAWDSVYVTPDAYDPSKNGVWPDYWLMLLTNDLTQAVYSTFLGGNEFEPDSKTVSVHDGVATIVGVTTSADFPTTTDALNPDFLGGTTDLTITRLGIPESNCCSGRVGDADGMGEYPDEVTLGDVMLMVDVKFVSNDCSKLPCWSEADLNQDGGDHPSCENHVTLGDIMILVDFLFITGPENATLPECL